jgi:secretion/DNA translocation related TadE-like protein
VVTGSAGGIMIGTAALARHRAQAAADLAALAAAVRLPLGPVAACGQARRLAAAMGAVLTGCDVDQLDVVVTTTVRTSGRLGGVARASARAGPSSVDQ